MLPESDPEADNAALTEKYKPLLTWMKGEAAHVVRDGALPRKATNGLADK